VEEERKHRVKLTTHKVFAQERSQPPCLKKIVEDWFRRQGFLSGYA